MFLGKTNMIQHSGSRVKQLHVHVVTSSYLGNDLDQKSDHPKISKNHHPTCPFDPGIFRKSLEPWIRVNTGTYMCTNIYNYMYTYGWSGT